MLWTTAANQENFALDRVFVPLMGRKGQTALRLKKLGSIGCSVHWRSVKYSVRSLILDTTANKVYPYFSIRSLVISTICYVKAC